MFFKNDMSISIGLLYHRQCYWFVGVTANITDCRSVATGSTPVRTATRNENNVGSSLLVKHHTVNVRNRVRVPESTK